jgi:hypothetical protein
MLTSSFLFPLLLSLAIEVSIALIFGYRSKLVLLGVVLVNLVTNPLLNYFLWLNAFFGFFTTAIINLVLLEILVVLVEWVLLTLALRQGYKSLLFLSAVMNFVSFITGLVLFK